MHQIGHAHKHQQTHLHFFPTLPFPPLFSSDCSGLHHLVDICCIYAIQLPCDCSSLSAIPAQLAHSDDCFLLGCICLAKPHIRSVADQPDLFAVGEASRFCVSQHLAPTSLACCTHLPVV